MLLKHVLDFRYVTPFRNHKPQHFKGVWARKSRPNSYFWAP